MYLLAVIAVAAGIEIAVEGNMRQETLKVMVLVSQVIFTKH